MKNYKKILMALSIIFGISAGGICWLLSAYHVIDNRLYPKNADVLDISDQKISIEEYERIAAAISDSHILWNIPFQGGLYLNDSEELTVTDLSTEDVEMLRYFPQLKTLHAETCTDYPQLLSLMHTYPDLEICCSIPIDGQVYSPEITELQLNNISESEVALLPRFDNLAVVTVSGNCDETALRLLRDHCFGEGIPQNLEVGTEWLKSAADHGNPSAAPLLQYVQEQTQALAVHGAFGLLKGLARMIRSEGEQEYHYKYHVESKLQQQIREKKQALGIRSEHEEQGMRMQ